MPRHYPQPHSATTTSSSSSSSSLAINSGHGGDSPTDTPVPTTTSAPAPAPASRVSVATSTTSTSSSTSSTNTNTNTSTNTSTNTNTTTYKYTVLYYKRKNNKVHQAKGVRKLDGVLTVQPLPNSLVTLQDGRQTVVSRRLHALAETSWHIEEVVTLGAYHVEIVAMEESSSSNSSSSSSSTSSTTINTSAAAATKTIGAGPVMARRRGMMIRSGGTPRTTAIPSRSYNPPPPRKQSVIMHALSDRDHSESSNDDEAMAMAIAIAIARTAGVTSASSTTTTIASKENNGASCRGRRNRMSSQPAPRGGRPSLKRPLLIMASSTTSASATATDSSQKECVPLWKRRVAPAQPKSAAASSSSSSTTTTTAAAAAAGGTTTSATTPAFRATTPAFRAYRRPGTTTGKLQQLQGQVVVTPPPPPPPPPPPSNLQFPGAIGGTIDLAPSIANVLKPHQRTGLVFVWNCLHARQGCILADEMGLGKTLLTIATIGALHRRKRDQKYVVVCPSSLVSNWAKEFDKWLGPAGQPKRVVLKTGADQGALKVFLLPNAQAQVLILSYDLFRRQSALFEGRPPVGLLVVDEGHRLKNTAGSLTLTSLQRLSTKARLLLTATPVQNVLSEFYTLADFCCPGILGDLSSFRRDFERPIAASTAKDCTPEQRQHGRQQAQALEQLTKPFVLRRLQKDILQQMLPPRVEIMLFCRPTRVQSELYQQITKATTRTTRTTRTATATATGASSSRGATITSSSGGGATAEALTTLTNLRKVCLHPILVQKERMSLPEVVDISQSSKLFLLEQLLVQIRHQAPTDKVVLVSNFTAALTLVEDHILHAHQWTSLRLDGTTPVQKRQALVDTFNRTSSERHFVFLLSSKAGGCGLNLVGANRLILLDGDWNPASDVQAMARVYRQGQTKPCTIYRLITSGTVEEVICQRQIQKGHLATRTVDGGGSSGMGFRKEELQDCFTLKTDCDCDTKRKLGSAWPVYHGPSSLATQGCDDTPLMEVASMSNTSLSYVRVVDEAVAMPSEEPDMALSVPLVDLCREETSEEEFQGDDSSDEDHQDGKPALEDSDDELEYEFQ